MENNEKEILDLLKDNLLMVNQDIKDTDSFFGYENAKSEYKDYYLIDFTNNLYQSTKPAFELGTGLEAVRSSAAMIYNTIGTDSITVNFYSDDASLVQSPAVSSDGGNIRLVINGKQQKSNIISGETEIDFSASKDDTTGKLTPRVFSADGTSYTDYKIKTIITPYNMNSIVAGNYIETDSISDNDVVLIVQKNSKVIMGSTNNSGVLSCVSLVDEPIPYEGGMAAVCVTIDNEGYYTFTFNNKFLTSKSTGSGLTFESSPSDYSLWSLEKQSNGTYVINNKAAVNGSRVQALEYYSEKFTTYGTGTGDAFEFTFYKK